MVDLETLWHSYQKNMQIHTKSELDSWYNQLLLSNVNRGYDPFNKFLADHFCAFSVELMLKLKGEKLDGEQSMLSWLILWRGE